MNTLYHLNILRNIMQSLIELLRIRATVRRQIITRKSVQENKPDRLADLLEEAANEIERLLNAKS